VVSAFGTGAGQILKEFSGRGAKGLEAILDGVLESAVETSVIDVIVGEFSPNPRGVLGGIMRR
jgi:hypothetical protein